MEKEANRSKFNKVVKPAKGVKVSAKAKGLGIVTSAVAYQYVKEIFPDCQILKLGWTNPLSIRSSRTRSRRWASR